MIEKVHNLTKKSFKNYTGPIDANFKNTNIIFGYNGKGKSSLAEGIVEEFDRTKSSKNDLFRFFNKDFVKDSMIINDDETKLKGVKVNFSKKNVDIEKTIKEKEKELVDISTIKSKLENKKERLQKEFSDIETNRKGKKKIRFNAIDWSNPLNQYNEAYKKAIAKIDSDEKLDNIKSNEDLERELDILNTIKIYNSFNVENINIDVLRKISETKYEKNDIPSKKIFDWIKEGNSIHKETNSKVCLFCGSSYNLDDITRKIALYENDKKQSDSNLLRLIYSNINKDITNIDSFLEDKETLLKLLSEDISEQINLIVKEKDNIIEITKLIYKKSEDITSSISIDFDGLENGYRNINNALEIINNKKNERIESLEKEIDNLNDLLKGSIAKEIIKNKQIEEEIDEIKELEKEISETNIKNTKINDEISYLLSSKSDIGDFANFVNDILIDLEMQIKIVPIENEYIIKHVNEDIELSMNNISEGESNMLALLFFYYELFTDEKQEKIKKDIKLIVIDDPISSVDDFNRIYIISLIRRLIDMKKDDLQLFVLTHVWDDFSEFCYRLDHNINGIFEIYKTTEGSKVEIANNSNEKPYKHCFKEVYEFSKKLDYHEMTDCEIYHYPNVMRRILEEFLSFKAEFHDVSNSRINAICEVFFGPKYTTRQRTDIAQIVHICNINSHENSRDPGEVLQAAKNLMKFIKNSDPNHFDTMANR